MRTDIGEVKLRPHAPFVTVTRLLLAATFAFAALGKLLATDTAYVTPRVLTADSALYAPILALERATPMLEAIVAAALFARIGALAAACIAVGLSAGFVTFAAMLPEGTRCHCFGLLGGFGSRPLHMVVTLTMLAASVAVAWATWRKGPGSVRPAHAGTAAADCGLHAGDAAHEETATHA